MDLLRALHECLTGYPYETNSNANASPPITDLKPHPLTNHTKMETEIEITNSILSLLTTTPKRGHDLELRIQELVHETGWYEGLAKRVLNGLVELLNSGAAQGGAMKESFDKASVVADSFIKEHPVFVEVVVTVVAIGILVLLVPWAVEALGFAEMGTVEGSFAAWWQSTIGDVEAGSFFSYLQRLGMIWGKK